MTAHFPYDLDGATRTIAGADPRMASLIARVGTCGLRLTQASSPFAALLRSIVYQQLSGKAAATIHARLEAAMGGPQRVTPDILLATNEQTLRDAGLSRNKLLALRDLAEKARNGMVPDFAALAAMDNEAIISELVKIRGIGRWTVEMLMIFTLGRPDVLPVDDLGIRKGFMAAYRKRKMPDASILERAGRRWAPYRSVASWYLWRAAEGM